MCGLFYAVRYAICLRIVFTTFRSGSAGSSSACIRVNLCLVVAVIYAQRGRQAELPGIEFRQRLRKRPKRMVQRQERCMTLNGRLQ